jgi:uncharacterized iron-regulated membrane protein
MPFNLRIFSRKAHRLGSIVIALPLLLVIGTGILLQLRKELPWVQPPTKKGSGKEPTISMEQILSATRSVAETGVSNWADIDRVDVRPKDGIVKVLCRSRWEVQVDFRTGEVLQSAYRRSELIEGLHDGAWFSDSARVYLYLPVAVVLLGLWVSGLYLWILPWSVKWRRKHVASERQTGEPRV